VSHKEASSGVISWGGKTEVEKSSREKRDGGNRLIQKENRGRFGEWVSGSGASILSNKLL